MTRILKPLTLAFMLLFLGACSNTKIIEAVGNEQEVANECRNQNFNVELDCYDLIAHKNSFAQLRLGINAKYNGNFVEAINRYEIAKKQKNFYANALIADLYINGFGVEMDENKAISLLKDTRKLDPIAAYKLSQFYLRDGDISDAIELLEFAGENGVKDAQNQLQILYSNSQYIDPDFEKTTYWQSKFNENNKDFIKEIYGR
ncbi:tetratricopeptide repeat protein [Arcobacter vandammei]|uniref:tetratricopeptide repeat protein n=1 Tax=Arcobacter vandammei TaxID=2782243 RepID=UPI0018DFC6BD|nr:sel1 repeat family protein [Arcobacter vandammei]